jgi:hypothetical protein
MKRNCCKDVQLSLKKNGDDQRVHPVVVSLVHPVVSPQPVFGNTYRDHHIPLRTLAPVKAPPPDAFPPVFLKNCVFII